MNFEWAKVYFFLKYRFFTFWRENFRQKIAEWAIACKPQKFETKFAIATVNAKLSSLQHNFHTCCKPNLTHFLKQGRFRKRKTIEDDFISDEQMNEVLHMILSPPEQLAPQPKKPCD